MQTIYKYPVPVAGSVTVPMPAGAKIIRIARQGFHIFAWAEVDTEKPIEPRTILCIGTGHDLDLLGKGERSYICSVETIDGLVWHYYESVK